MSGADLTARAARRSWYKPARCGSGPPEKGRRAMSKWRSVGIIALAGVCGAAYAGRAPRARRNHPMRSSSPAPQRFSPRSCAGSTSRARRKTSGCGCRRRRARSPSIAWASAARSFDYTATAGTLIIRDDEDKPIASIGYVAYVRHDLKGGGARPLMFAFNGGPGSSSLWLHMACSDPSASWCPIRARRRRPVSHGGQRIRRARCKTRPGDDRSGRDGLSHAVCDH